MIPLLLNEEQCAAFLKGHVRLTVFGVWATMVGVLMMPFGLVTQVWITTDRRPALHAAVAGFGCTFALFNVYAMWLVKTVGDVSVRPLRTLAIA